MNLIDIAGLTDSTIPGQIYVKALRLQGYIIPEEDRDAVLEALREPGFVEPGTCVYTGPGELAFWSAAATGVRVRVVPGNQELPQDRRCDSTLEWFLTRKGVSLAAARTFVTKPPTERHAQYQAYTAAVRDALAWDAGMEGSPDIRLEGFEYVGGEAPTGAHAYEVHLVTDWATYTRLGQELEQAKRLDTWIGLDVESDEEENYESILVGVGISFPVPKGPGAEGGRGIGSCYYLPLNGPLGEGPAMALLWTHFGARECPWFVAHNGKYDMQVLALALWRYASERWNASDSPVSLLRRLGARLAGDGLIAAYCASFVDNNNGRPLPKGLKDLTKRYYGVENLTFKEMLGLSGATCSSEAPITDIGPYCCADAFWGVKVLDAVLEDLRRTPKLRDLYQKLELRIIPILAEMEFLGLPIDVKALEDRRRSYTKKVEILRKYLEEAAIEAGYTLKTERHKCKLHDGKRASYSQCPVCDDAGRIESTVPFNPNSGPQVAAVLQGTFELPRFNSTEGGDVSNDEPALLRLREYASDAAAKDWITFNLAWRKASKTKGTYLDGLWERKRQDVWQQQHGPQFGPWFVHPVFNQDIVVTGRLSSKDPNAQNFQPEVRDLFLVNWDADYSQLELRIFAKASGCRAMIETFQADGDIHATTAARIFGIPPDQLKKQPVMRVKAKTLNFGMSYGAGADTVLEQITKAALLRPDLEIEIPTLAECGELVKKFWIAYPEARAWVDFIKEVNRDRGYAEDLYGRREYLPMAKSWNNELRARADRQGVNMIIQGTSGTMIKMAMAMLREEQDKYHADVRGQVHDELLGVVSGSDENKAAWLQAVRRCMELDQPLWPVPLKVEPGLGRNWKEAK